MFAACARAPAPAPAALPPIEPVSEARAAAMRSDGAALRAHGRDLFAEVVARYRDWPRSDRAFGRAARFVRTPVPFRGADGTWQREQLPVAFVVVLDPTAAEHVAALGTRGQLAALRALGAPLPEFPRSAIALKLVYYALHRDRPLRLPRFSPTRASAAGNPDHTWRDTDTIARIGDIVHETLATDAQVADARAATGDATLARGDYLALVALHVTTKELPDWIWATYTWDPREPSHYRMDISTDGSRPSFNPWLEARFPDGLASSCIHCHERAAFGAADYLPVTTRTTPPGDPYFTDKLPTDFLWSLALESP